LYTCYVHREVHTFLNAHEETVQSAQVYTYRHQPRRSDPLQYLVFGNTLEHTRSWKLMPVRVFRRSIRCTVAARSHL
jgi:hypothetical protein